ncbi:MAG: ABC transporter ATP-binding protein [Clostridiales bacterium]|nr:ABC transporter ATP-binding protein [Clostridiales bacterium]
MQKNDKFIIQTKDLNRFFPVAGGKDFHALKDINIEIPRNTLSILKGRSGSGKTTLINLLGALDKPTSGIIYIENQDTTKFNERQRELLRRQRIGFIFQSVSLIPIMTAFENVEFALRLSGFKGDKKERVSNCLQIVGLGNRMHHMPQELSGGEQQRVAIARAIAHRPMVIFADEPTAELDSNSALNVMKIFKELVSKEKVTIIMTTHDMGLMDAADVIYELEDGEVVNG